MLSKKYLKDSVTRFLLKGTAAGLWQHRAVKQMYFTFSKFAIKWICHFTECDELFFLIINLNGNIFVGL